MSVSGLCSLTGGVALGGKCNGLLPCFPTDCPSDQFVNDDNIIALPAIYRENMQREYQEMCLIFTIGPSGAQPATGYLFLQSLPLIRPRSWGFDI